MINNAQITSKNNPYGMFKNADYTSNAQYLSKTYGNRQLYYDDIDLSTKQNDEKQRKKGRLKFALIVGAFTLAGLTAISGAILSKGRFKNFSIENAKEVAAKAAETVKGAADSVNKTVEKANVKTKMEQVSNAMGNTINIKDDIWQRISDGAEDKLHIKLLNKFNNLCTDTAYKIYNFFNSRKINSMAKRLTELGVDAPMADINADRGKIREKLTEILNGDSSPFKRFYQNKKLNLADFFNGNFADRNILENNIDFSKYTVNAAGKGEEAQKLAEKFNNEIFAMKNKYRDLSCGSAPTDILTVITSAIGFSGALAFADNKEERKSLAVNLGIPLATTLSFNIMGTAIGLSGSRSMIAGLAVGQLASGVAKAIDKAVKNKKQAKEEHFNKQA